MKLTFYVNPFLDINVPLSFFFNSNKQLLYLQKYFLDFTKKKTQNLPTNEFMQWHGTNNLMKKGTNRSLKNEFYYVDE